MEFAIKKSLLIIHFDKSSKNDFIQVIPEFIIFNNKAEAEYYINERGYKMYLHEGKVMENFGNGEQVGKYKYANYLKIDA